MGVETIPFTWGIETNIIPNFVVTMEIYISQERGGNSDLYILIGRKSYPPSIEIITPLNETAF